MSPSAITTKTKAARRPIIRHAHLLPRERDLLKLLLQPRSLRSLLLLLLLLVILGTLVPSTISLLVLL